MWEGGEGGGEGGDRLYLTTTTPKLPYKVSIQQKNPTAPSHMQSFNTFHRIFA